MFRSNLNRMYTPIFKQLKWKKKKKLYNKHYLLLCLYYINGYTFICDLTLFYKNKEMKRLPCFISHFMQQWLHLILKHIRFIINVLVRKTHFQMLRKITKAELKMYKCTCGVVKVVVLLMLSSIWAVWTSRVSNWCSNLSMRAEIWKRKKGTEALSWNSWNLFYIYFWSIWEGILHNVEITLPFPDSYSSEWHPSLSPLQP